MPITRTQITDFFQDVNSSSVSQEIPAPPCSEQPAIYPYPKPDKTIPHQPMSLLSSLVHLDLPSSLFLSLILSHKTMCAFLFSPIRASCLYHQILLILTTQVLIDGQIPVAAGSKAWVCGRLFVRIAGFESRQWHGCLSLVITVHIQVKVFAMSRSLVQRSSTESGVSN